MLASPVSSCRTAGSIHSMWELLELPQDNPDVPLGAIHVLRLGNYVILDLKWVLQLCASYAKLYCTASCLFLSSD